MRNIKIIEWAMTNNEKKKARTKMEMKMFHFPFHFFFAPLSPSFCHHKAFSDLPRHILSLLPMSKMANKNVYDARTHSGEFLGNVPKEALNTY